MVNKGSNMEGKTAKMKEYPKEWWGNYSFNTGESAQWEIGSLRIAVQRLPHEWLVAHEPIESVEEQGNWQFAYGDQDLNEGEFARVLRFVFKTTTEQLTILPALADRSVVSRPYTAFTVPAEENVTIYVSTPLWFTLSTGLPKKMFEFPIQRPSDTWFGSSTREGEICYASRTYARLNLQNLTVYPYRAITQVLIHNNSVTPLLIERLNLPVPYLSLFYSQEKILWTESVAMVQTQGTSPAEFNIEKEPPPTATGAKLIAAPRQDPQKGMLIKTFSALTLHGFD